MYDPFKNVERITINNLKCRKIYTTMKMLRLTVLNWRSWSATIWTTRISKASKELCSRSLSSKLASIRIFNIFSRFNPNSTSTSKTKIRNSFKFLRNSKAFAAGSRIVMNSGEWPISHSLLPPNSYISSTKKSKILSLSSHSITPTGWKKWKRWVGSQNYSGDSSI